MKKGIIRYDIISGFRNNLGKIVVFFIMIVGISMINTGNIKEVESLYNINATIVDYFLVFMSGPKYISEGALDMYQIPVLWLLPQIMISYIAGYYAMTNIDKEGLQALVRANTRRKWWISKCIWNGTMVTFLYFLMYGVIIVNASINGADMRCAYNMEILNELCDIFYINGTNTEILLMLLFMPLLVSLTINILQMTIALIFSPIIGFIFSQSIVFLSTIITNKWLISNLGMLSHSKIVGVSDITIKTGIMICIGVYVLFVIVGYEYFKRYDVVVREVDS